MKADSSIGVGARSTILKVALDDAAYVRELAAYLVMPARKQLHLNEKISLGVPNEAVA